MHLKNASKYLAIIPLMFMFFVSFSFANSTTKPATSTSTKKNTTTSTTTKKNTASKSNASTTTSKSTPTTGIINEDWPTSTDWTVETTDNSTSSTKKTTTKKNCKTVEVQKKCWEDEDCSWGTKIEKEEICSADEDKLPSEVKALYQQIAQKYWKGSKGYIEYNGSKYTNASMIYGAVAMKELKDGVQNIDNEVKINFELSRLSSMSIGGVDIDGLKGYTPNVRSAKSYVTTAMYVRSIKVLEALYKLSWQTESAKKLADHWNAILPWVQMLLDYGFAYGIVLQENGAVYGNENGDNKALIKQYAGNGWAFQITWICGNAYNHSLEQGKGAKIYLNWHWIGGMNQFYAVAPEAIWRAMKNEYDKQCINFEGVQSFTNTPELLIKLWRSHQQIDPERANYLKTTLFVGSSDEAQLLTYLGRELQFMFQFYNYGSFMAHKMGNAYSFSPKNLAISTYSKGSYGMIKKNLEKIGITNYTREDWIQDVEEWKKFVKTGYSGSANFILKTKGWNAFPSSSPAMRFTSDKNYAEFIAFHLAGAIGALYNGIAYSHIYNNPYVNKIPMWALESRLWLPWDCGQIVGQIWVDGGAVIQRKGFNQSGGMYVQTRTYLSDRYHIPLNNTQNDGYVKMQKWAYKNLGITRAVLSCFRNGSVVF